MAVINGSDLILKVSPSDGGTERNIMHSQNCSLSTSLDLADITTKYNSGWKNAIPTMKSFSISADGLMDLNSTGTDTELDELFDQFESRIPVTFTFTRSTSVSGEYTFSGSGYITSLEVAAGTEEVATYSVSIEGNGQLTKTNIV